MRRAALLILLAAACAAAPARQALGERRLREALADPERAPADAEARTRAVAVIGARACERQGDTGSGSR